MSKQIKCKCGNDTFRITEIEDCSNCQNNGAYPNDDSEDLIYDDEIIKKLNLVRDQVNYEQTCRIGEAFDNGCHIYACTKCCFETNLAMIGDW